MSNTIDCFWRSKVYYTNALLLPVWSNCRVISVFQKQSIILIWRLCCRFAGPSPHGRCYCLSRAVHFPCNHHPLSANCKPQTSNLNLNPSLPKNSHRLPMQLSPKGPRRKVQEDPDVMSMVRLSFSLTLSLSLTHTHTHRGRHGAVPDRERNLY